MPGFYLYNEDQWGFSYIPERTPLWAQVASPPTPAPPDPTDIRPIACTPDTVYAIWANDDLCRISGDAGATWSAQGSIQPVPEATEPVVFSLEARASNEVYLLNIEAASDVLNKGILRSLNGGLSWTRIVDISQLTSSFVALGSPAKLWFAQRTTSSSGPPATRTWAFRRANFDGSSIETIASHTFTQDSGAAISLPANLMLRAITDDFLLVTSYFARDILLVTSSGTVTSIRPAGLYRPWETMALDDQVYLAVGQPQPGTTADNNDVLIYRTTNAGSSWTLAATIPADEGLAVGGRVEERRMIDGYGSDVYVLGNAAFAVQQIIWVSDDAGSSWTSIVNDAEEFDAGEGGWTLFGPGGLKARPPAVVQVAIPSRLATIVG